MSCIPWIDLSKIIGENSKKMIVQVEFKEVSFSSILLTFIFCFQKLFREKFFLFCFHKQLLVDLVFCANTPILLSLGLFSQH